MLAHELRTPLSAISAAVRVLELTNTGEQPASRACDVIARQVGHITHLINDLLDVERVVSGKIRLNRQPLDMADAVRQAVASFTGDALLDRRIDVSTEPVWVDWDAERLEQVADEHRDQRDQIHAARRPDSRVTPRRRRRRRARPSRTRASASRPGCCPSSSTCTCRPIGRWTARAAASGSAWRSSAAWSSCTAARSWRRATEKGWAAVSPSG